LLPRALARDVPDRGTSLADTMCPQPSDGIPAALHTEAYQAMLASARGASREEYMPLTKATRPFGSTPVKLLAFYLPQFHRIPENDDAWGLGFTEWTNVSKAVPQFLGQHQPHLPGELGFYDLRVPEVQRRQVELAKLYGIHGFCFYYYWFAGRRVLERPLTTFLADPQISFPFCLCWANENWTRAWDGMDKEVLLAQNHSRETDNNFIQDVVPILRHRNYLRIHGRPVLVVYRVRMLPDPASTAQRWRERCQELGLENPYLIAAQVFEFTDPRDIGFDAVLEFPPNTPYPRADITRDVTLLNPEYQGHVYRYDDLAEASQRLLRPPYQLFRTVTPTWDNEPRCPGRGSTFAFSSPEAYGRWLDHACRYTLAEPDPDARLVFINAWNEWGEGAHLEPDRRFGYAYLQRTADVLGELRSSADVGRPVWTMLVVSHDAARGGSQVVLLNLIEWLRRHTSIRLKILCLAGGEWLARFESLADTALLDNLSRGAADTAELHERIEEFCGCRPDLIYCNSVASGRALATLRTLGAPIITHFHELEMSITRYARDWIGDVLADSTHFIACSEAVRQNLVQRHHVAPEKIALVYSSIRPEPAYSIPSEVERARLRARLVLPPDKLFVLGCGIGMPFRKGADLFIQVARRVLAGGRSDVQFLWIGGLDPAEQDPQLGVWRDHLAALDGTDANNIRFLGLRDDPRQFFQVGDLFLLTSREDPFPLVALEAAESGLPILCFDQAGGMPEFVGRDSGNVLAFGDVAAMAARVEALLACKATRQAIGAQTREGFLRHFTVARTSPSILSACRTIAGKKPAVSVIVPNYNHARYLPERLASIASQSMQDFEVILLDDCSSDDSIPILERFCERADTRLVRNEHNSGSTFKQWLKGLALARADIIWIAESDDRCEPDFLARLLPAFYDPHVKLAYANSHVIDERGQPAGDYTSTDYLLSLSPTKWLYDYRVTAEEEINAGLGVKNTILSASSMLFRKFQLGLRAYEVLQNMHIAGDWYFIVHAIAGGSIAYTASALNHHRRHTQSVIGSMRQRSRIADFYRETHQVHETIFKMYPLGAGFAAKWEQYVRSQWQAFFPGRSFSYVQHYYPFDAVRELLAKTLPGSSSARGRA
jgi:glycosyltransferase involved in cell wall biosynthesis